MQTVDVTGVWIGDFAAKSVSGGECLADTLAANLRPLPTATAVSIAFTQAGSLVDATTTKTTSGATYSYSGTVSDSIMSVTGTSCSGCNMIGLLCPDGSGTRDLRLRSATVSANVSSEGTTFTTASMVGTDSETYDVLIGGTSTQVGIVTFSNLFSACKSTEMFGGFCGTVR